MLTAKGTLVPARIVDPLARVLAPAFWPPLVALALAALVVADVVLLTRGDFWGAINHLFATPTLALLVYRLLTAAALVHELGHAAACRYGGAHPGEIGFGLYLATHVDGRLGEAIADRTEAGRWRDDFFFGHLNFGEGGGGLELFPLIALPLAALLLASRAQRFYAVAFTGALFATVLNPLAHLAIVLPALGLRETGRAARTPELAPAE